MVPVPLLARRFAIRQPRDDVVQKLVAFLDPARLGDDLQSAPVARAALALSQSATHALRMEITDDDRVSGPYLDQQGKERAAGAARSAGGKPMLPVSPAGHGRAPCVPGVHPVSSAGCVLAQRTAPHPEGDRSEVIEASDDLPESEGETQDGRVWVADKRQATGAREEVPWCYDLVALALYHNAGYPSLQSWKDEHTARFQNGQISANDLTQLEGVALLFHENEDVLGEECDPGEICIGRAAAKLECYQLWAPKRKITPTQWTVPSLQYTR